MTTLNGHRSRKKAQTAQSENLAWHRQEHGFKTT
jgi:hypothetical protein